MKSLLEEQKHEQMTGTIPSPLDNVLPVAHGDVAFSSGMTGNVTPTSSRSDEEEQVSGQGQRVENESSHSVEGGINLETQSPSKEQELEKTSRSNKDVLKRKRDFELRS